VLVSVQLTVTQPNKVHNGGQHDTEWEIRADSAKSYTGIQHDQSP